MIVILYGFEGQHCCPSKLQGVYQNYMIYI